MIGSNPELALLRGSALFRLLLCLDGRPATLPTPHLA